MRFLELEAVRRLVGADERHERELVELELRVVGSLEHVDRRELAGDDREHILRARELAPQRGLVDLSGGVEVAGPRFADQRVTRRRQDGENRDETEDTSHAR